MSVPQGAMQSLQMLQAALTAAQPQVTEGQMMGGPMQAQPQAGVGTGAARLGSAAGGMLGMSMGGDSNPLSDELTMAILDAPDELYAAASQMEDDARQYANTKSRRFRGPVGGAEAIFDLVMGKKTHKDLQESKTAFRKEQTNYKQLQQKAELDIEMKRRQDYVNNLLPQYIANNPGINHQAAVAFLTQAAVQKMPVEKVLPDGPVIPVAETYIDPQTKAEMTRFRNPETGQIMTGEQYKPFVSKGASEKTTGTTSKWMETVDSGGNTFQTQYGMPDANGDMQILQQIPTGKNTSLKNMSAMPGETRRNAGLVANASRLVANSMPLLFDDNGDWNSLAAHTPMSETKAALNGYSTAVKQAVRIESGAAVPESEIVQASEQYIPNLTDSDITAQRKVQRFAEYMRTLYKAQFAGYKVEDPNLAYTDFTQPWMETAPAVIAEAANAVEDLDDELDARFRAALLKAEQSRP